nr:immunoglobulin light chain junction region [Macaca mulatta]MOW65513.1 immunoglobulin light chain junction region [Macaca mulatta]
CMQGVEFPVTF